MISMYTYHVSVNKKIPAARKTIFGWLVNEKKRGAEADQEREEYSVFGAGPVETLMAQRKKTAIDFPEERVVE